MNICPSCHKCIIPDLPGREPMAYQPWGDDSEVIILCATCATEFTTGIKKRKSEKGRMKYIFDFLKKVSMVLVLVFVATCAKSALSDVKDQKDWVKGGVIIGISASGSCFWKPFVVVGYAEDDPDTGDTQLLGYSPGNVQLDKNGKVIWERVRAEVFVERGHRKVYRGRMCQCPSYNL